MGMISRILRNSKEILLKEGTVYTFNKKNSPYNGARGMVSHHNYGTRFMIFKGGIWLCNIKP